MHINFYLNKISALALCQQLIISIIIIFIIIPCS